MLPIILSAPHGGRQPIPEAPVRRGVGVAQFTTGRDNNTGELVERIAAKLEERFGAKPFLIIALFERKYVDANRPSASAYESDQGKLYYEFYHQELRAACERVRREWGRGLLLDIHGQGTGVDTIYRGTSNGKTVMSLVGRFGRAAVSGAASMLGQLPPARSLAASHVYHELDLPEQVALAGLDLVWHRVAITWGSAFDHIRDVHVRTGHADPAEKLVEELPRLADERIALLVLVEARRLADEHHFGLGVAHAEDDLCAPLGQAAARAAGDLGRVGV